MRQYLSKIKFAYALSKAFDLASKKQYDEALSLLKKYKKAAEKERLKILDYFILLGEIFTHKREFEKALWSFSEALDILSRTESYNQDEKEYLRKYISLWLAYIDSDSDFIIENIPLEFTFDDKKIRKSLIIHFPLNQIQS